jgi:hypothetical protein
MHCDSIILFFNRFIRRKSVTGANAMHSLPHAFRCHFEFKYRRKDASARLRDVRNFTASPRHRLLRHVTRTQHSKQICDVVFSSHCRRME